MSESANDTPNDVAGSAASHCYVDALLAWPKSDAWKYGKACHLMIDAMTPIDILHEFASRIGMKRSWFQVSASGVPHYDLTARRRAMAVRLGAVEVDRIKTVEIMRGWRVASST